MASRATFHAPSRRKLEQLQAHVRLCLILYRCSGTATTTMDEPVVKKQDKLITIVKSPGDRDEGGDGEDGDSADDEQCDPEVWDKLSRSFRQAQSVLDQNRALIQQVNENHQSKIPDNLAKNVALIGQLNGNISKVLSIYSDLSIDFSNIVHQRRRQRQATTVSTENGKD